MTTRRTATQWQQLLSARAIFSVTNIEFCKQHNISITSFYKQKAIVRQQSDAHELTVLVANLMQFSGHSKCYLVAT